MLKPYSRSRMILLLFVMLALLTIFLSILPMHTSRAASGCQVIYTPHPWDTGLTADVKIVNNNTAAISGWTLTWSFANGQQITGSWNATVTQSGANVTASNPAGHWNGTIGANGGSVSFGFQATHTGTNDIPTNFVLNGVACNQQNTVTDTPSPTVAIHPDLVISSIVYDGGVEGTCTIPANQGVRVTIRNTGNANAGAFVVTLNTTRSATIAGLAMGAETSVFFQGSNPVNVTAVVDPDDLIDEISEDNNQRTAVLPVPTGYPPVCIPTPLQDMYPDLIVSSIVYAPGTPSGCVTPPDMGTRVFVRNIGFVNAGAFVVTLNNTLSANVPGLAAGAETSILFSQNVMQNTAVVDTTNLIVESNETNNQLTASLPVPTQAPTCTPTPTGTCANTVIQAEAASRGGGTTVDSNNAGYTGTGFVNFPANGGYIQFNSVNGGSGGGDIVAGTLRVRYALASGSRTGRLTVNGVAQNITFTSTGSWSTWLVRDINISLNAGATNTIRFQSTGQDLANIDQIEVVVCSTATPTFTPTPMTPLPCGTLAPGQTPVPGCFPSPTPPILYDTPFTGCAYLDENGNGAIDPAEPRLGGMSFSITLNGGTGFGALTSAGLCATVIVPSALPVNAWPVLARMVAPAGSGYQLVGSSVISLAYPQTRADFLFVVAQ